MRTKDMEPGRFYKVRFQKVGGHVPTEVVRFERVEELTPEQRNYGFTQPWLICTRFLMGGTLEIRCLPRDVLAPEEPSERTRKIMDMIEQQGPVVR